MPPVVSFAVALILDPANDLSRGGISFGSVHRAKRLALELRICGQAAKRPQESSRGSVCPSEAFDRSGDTPLRWAATGLANTPTPYGTRRCLQARWLVDRRSDSRSCRLTVRREGSCRRSAVRSIAAPRAATALIRAILVAAFGDLIKAAACPGSPHRKSMLTSALLTRSSHAIERVKSQRSNLRPMPRSSESRESLPASKEPQLYAGTIGRIVNRQAHRSLFGLTNIRK